jgi:hypothetical protein
VLLLVCGLLVWLTPNQRFFYAIIGTLTAVYALIGLNLGGFLLGTVIGMIGGGMAFAWTPEGEETAPSCRWRSRPGRGGARPGVPSPHWTKPAPMTTSTDPRVRSPIVTWTSRPHRRAVPRTGPARGDDRHPLVDHGHAGRHPQRLPGPRSGSSDDLPHERSAARGWPASGRGTAGGGRPARAAPPAAAPPAAPPAAAPPAAPTTTSAPPPAAVPTTAARRRRRRPPTAR